MTRKERAKFWQKHVESWQESGVTRPRYCEQHGLAVSTFDSWRKRLKTGAVERKRNFIPISPASAPNKVTLHLPSGIRLETPVELLGRVLAEIG